MNQRDLLLVGGGLVAGYVICKMMNRNSEPMSFSLSGQDDTISEGRGFEGQKFKFNGKGIPLRTMGSSTSTPFETLPPQKYLNKSFELSGQSIKLILMTAPYAGKYGKSDSPNAILYYQSLITEQRGGSSSIRRIWFPAESLVKI
tara:strand:+ start:275 stop:709 length:435 start_codon:yes stop_codon:yes gene_type:complete